MRLTCVLVLGCAVASVAGPSSLLSVPKCAASPTIDGVLSPGEWAGAGVTCGWRNVGSGQPAQAEAVVSACYDSRALYLAYECAGEPLDKLAGAPGARDSAIWGGPLVEAFLAAPDWPVAKYAHLMLAHDGTIADELCTAEGRDLGWNPDWQHATGKGDGVWIAEMAVPWAALGMDGPKPGTRLRANLARNAAAIGELCSWAEVAGGFHQPESFGTFVLAGEGPVVAVRALPGRAIGPAQVAATLIGSAAGARLTARLETPAGVRRVTTALNPGPAGSVLQMTIPGGTSRAEFAAAAASGEELWAQALVLDLPDLAARVQPVRELLATLGGESAIAPAELAELRTSLDRAAAKAWQPLDAAGIAAVGDEIAQVQQRARDLAMLGAMAGRAPGRPGEVLSYFVTNPVATAKIQPTCPDAGPLAETLRIAMARGEYEPTQIAVCAIRADLKGVRVLAGELRDGRGHRIPAGRVVVNPLGFVRCRTSSPGARLTGEVPDVLLPNRAVDVAAGRRQPFLITVQTLAADAPGEYRGALRVKPANAPAVRLPLVVRVYSVILPAKSHLRTAFVLWGNFRNWLGNSSQDAFLGAYIRYSKVMLAHRISPITMWSPKKGAGGAWDFSDYDRYLAATVPAGLTTLNVGGNGEVAGSRNVDFAQAAAKHFKERGWWGLHYVYGWDEAPGDALGQLQTNYKALIDAVPGIKIMQTGWSPNPKLKGLVKIWCPLTAGENPATTREAQAAGDEVWWYVCCGPTAPFANLLVDYPGIDHRMLGWQTFQHNIQGFLYWGVDVWPGNTAPLAEYEAADYANWNPNSFSTINGDGYLLYPGPHDSPLASLRLALLRDGFEDYDLFTEVRALAERAGSAGAAARELLVIGPEISRSLTSFTQDGNVLLARREAILEAAEGLCARGR